MPASQAERVGSRLAPGSGKSAKLTVRIDVGAGGVGRRLRLCRHGVCVVALLSRVRVLPSVAIAARPHCAMEASDLQRVQELP